MPKAAHCVLCVSWVDSLAVTRKLLLRQAGYRVISAVGEEEEQAICKMDGDLLVFGHSVPQDRKQALIESFSKHSAAPVLSLLGPGQRKVPQATFGVEPTGPEDFIRAVLDILPRSA